MRIIIVLLLFLLLVGCNGEMNELKNDQNLCPQEMSAIVDDQKFALLEGNYMCIKKRGSKTEVVQTDAVGPVETAEQIDPIQMEKMSLVTFQAVDSPTIVIFLWHSDDHAEEIPLQSKNQLLLPKENGEYIYEVIGTWPDAEVSYTFFIEIK